MSHLSLFEGYGIEIELMIVDKKTLQVRPIADELLKTVAGEYVSEIENGEISWSNELVAHVIELKTTQPAKSLEGLSERFHANVSRINTILEKFSAMLMPTAMHPFMDPMTETKLWPHDNNEIYNAYNRIFDCRGHGWSNLQSMHINLPFRDSSEFRRLHSAIRCLLPLIPALSASSPIVEKNRTGFFDSRLSHYRKNQARVPFIAGQVIPEAIMSIADYHEKILSRIFEDIKPYDTDGILNGDWLNSRGAIARFERQSIEIRVIDNQECPKADLAIADLIVGTLKAIVHGDIGSIEKSEQIPTETLKAIFDRVIQSGSSAEIIEPDYLQLFTTDSTPQSANTIWKQLIQLTPATSYRKTQEQILEHGSLAERICRALRKKSQAEIYEELCTCLAENETFMP
jgi:carboxylate-amine ligase